MNLNSVLTVVVVTHNSARHLPSFAASVSAGLAGVDHARLVVVDNSSTDDTPALVRELLPHATLIEPGRNGGYAMGINTGLRAVQAVGPVLVLNPDVRMREGAVRKLLDVVDDDQVGIAVPRLVDRNGVLSTSLRREPALGRVWAEAVLGGRRAAAIGRSEVVVDAEEYAHDHDVDWATGAVMAISAACRSAIGDWDESFFLYSEEVDYCRRARRAGFAVRFVAAAVAEHDGGEYQSNATLWRTLVRNRAWDFDRHHGPVQSALFRAGLVVNEVLRAPQSAAHRAGARAAADASDPGPQGTGRPAPQPFIWFAAQDWWYHNQAHSDFQLMREVAKTAPVLVVNSLGLRLPRRGVSTNPSRRILRKLRSMTKLVRRPLPDNPGFHVMTPVLLPFYGETALARFNAWAVRQQVRLVARSIGIGSRPTIGVTIPTAWPVVRRMRRSALLFNRSDLHSAFPEADNAWVEKLENELLEHSDRVVYVSHELMRQDAERTRDRAFFLDHGVDLEHFCSDDVEIDPDVAAISRPRIGFFGGLDDYVVDIDLLRQTATELADLQLVLVGDATCSMDELTALPNVHWLGFRPYAEIPAIGRGFDVALMPWLDNEWIRYANPIKLKEYLALGLPVVTTEYPEVEAYRDVVWVAADRASFPATIRTALDSDTDPSSRRDFVLRFSWRARAETLIDLVRTPGAH